MANIGYLAWDLAEKYGQKPCLRDDHVELTYEEFADRTEAVAAQLAGLGIGLGDVVAIMLPNRVELLIAIMAAWRIGAAATPINPMFTANEADYQIADSGAELVITATATHPRAAAQCWPSRIWRQCRRPIPDPESMLQQTIWRCSSTPAAPPDGPRE